MMMGKIDFTNFVPDMVTWWQAYGPPREWPEDWRDVPELTEEERQEAIKRIQEWDPERLKRAQRWPKPDDDPEEYELAVAYLLGTVKRPAGWPKGLKAKREPTRYAMEFVREAQRQLRKQGQKRFVNLHAVQEALDYLKSIGWSGLKFETLKKNLDQDR
jgi:hypothetical protein